MPRLRPGASRERLLLAVWGYREALPQRGPRRPQRVAGVGGTGKSLLATIRMTGRWERSTCRRVPSSSIGTLVVFLIPVDFSVAAVIVSVEILPNVGLQFSLAVLLRGWLSVSDFVGVGAVWWSRAIGALGDAETEADGLARDASARQRLGGLSTDWNGANRALFA